MKHRYFVGYIEENSSGPEGFAAGGIDVNLELPIASVNDVLDVQAKLRKHYGNDTLAVISFSKYEEDNA
jgi:hypothetical protein